jgi:hypothetical protein
LLLRTLGSAFLAVWNRRLFRVNGICRIRSLPESTAALLRSMDKPIGNHGSDGRHKPAAQGARSTADRRRRVGRVLWTAVFCGSLLILFWATRPNADDTSAQPLSPGYEPRADAAELSSPRKSVVSAATVMSRVEEPPVIQRIMPYGPGEGEVGMIRADASTPVGPESFAVTPTGNILIADLVNRRVLISDLEGRFLQAIQIPVTMNDIAADARGSLYVYEQRTHTIHQYDSSGAHVTTLQLDARDIDTRGYFHVQGDSVYFADAAARDVLVGTLKGGILNAPEPGTGRHSAGIHGRTGRLYAVSVRRGEAMQVDVRSPGVETRQIEVGLPGIVSACYVGEDDRGSFYVQTERPFGGRIELQLMAFNGAGELLNSIPLADNEYSIWTTRLAAVAADGTVVQFVPGEDHARLNIIKVR